MCINGIKYFSEYGLGNITLTYLGFIIDNKLNTPVLSINNPSRALKHNSTHPYLFIMLTISNKSNHTSEIIRLPILPPPSLRHERHRLLDPHFTLLPSGRRYMTLKLRRAHFSRGFFS